jgi:hypothetical protein
VQHNPEPRVVIENSARRVARVEPARRAVRLVLDSGALEYRHDTRKPPLGAERTKAKENRYVNIARDLCGYKVRPFWNYWTFARQ